MSDVTVLPPGWEAPESLPAGMTMAPADDPQTAARLIAERVRGQLVVDVAAAERALAVAAARRRSEQVVADAVEAVRLVDLLRGADASADQELLSDALDADDRGPGVRVRSSMQLAHLAAAAYDRFAPADADELRAAGARLRAAEVTAAAARRVVGERPTATLSSPSGAVWLAELEVVRARSLSAAASAEVHDATPRNRSASGATTGATAVAFGAGVLLVGVGVPALVGLGVPTAAVGALLVHGRQRRRTVVAARQAEADAAIAAADDAEDEWLRLAGEEEAWRARAAAADAAEAELAAARDAWTIVAGDLDVARVDRVVDALALLGAAADALEIDCSTPASQIVFEARRAEQYAEEQRARREYEVTSARARLEARARLHELLHGRPLDRLQADAEHARRVLAMSPPVSSSPLVLCEPFAAVGAGRRRALLRDLERAAAHLSLAVVTSDREAIAWAAAHSRLTPEIG